MHDDICGTTAELSEHYWTSSNHETPIDRSMDRSNDSWFSCLLSIGNLMLCLKIERVIYSYRPMKHFFVVQTGEREKRNGKMKRKDRRNKGKRKSTIDDHDPRYFDDFCFVSLTRNSSVFKGRAIGLYKTRANRAKRKRKMVRAIITATLLSSHRINIIRCIV